MPPGGGPTSPALGVDGAPDLGTPAQVVRRGRDGTSGGGFHEDLLEVLWEAFWSEDVQVTG